MSRTSPPRTTSSRPRRRRPAETPSGTATPPPAGLPALREAIATKTLRDSGLEVAANQVLVTNGGKQALYNAFAALLNPGDEVLLPAPYWTTYPESIRLAGGDPVIVHDRRNHRVPRHRRRTWRLPVTDRTKMLVFVSPSNPTGAVYSPAEVEAIGRVGARARHRGSSPMKSTSTLSTATPQFSSMPVLVPELADQCVVINGVAKTYAMTGWRVGWMIGPADVVKAATNLQSHATSNVANVSQVAALAAVSGDSKRWRR